MPTLHNKLFTVEEEILMPYSLLYCTGKLLNFTVGRTALRLDLLRKQQHLRGCKVAGPGAL